MSLSYSLNQKELHGEVSRRLAAAGIKPVRACFYHARPGLVRLDLVRGYAPAMDRVHLGFSPCDMDTVRVALGDLLPQIIIA